MLQTTNVDRPLLHCSEITATDAEVRGRADHTTADADRIVAKDGLGGAIVVLGRDRRDEALDVDLRVGEASNGGREREGCMFWLQ